MNSAGRGYAICDCFTYHIICSSYQSQLSATDRKSGFHRATGIWACLALNLMVRNIQGNKHRSFPYAQSTKANCRIKYGIVAALSEGIYFSKSAESFQRREFNV